MGAKGGRFTLAGKHGYEGADGDRAGERERQLQSGGAADSVGASTQAAARVVPDHVSRHFTPSRAITALP